MKLETTKISKRGGAVNRQDFEMTAEEKEEGGGKEESMIPAPISQGKKWGGRGKRGI